MANFSSQAIGNHTPEQSGNSSETTLQTQHARSWQVIVTDEQKDDPIAANVDEFHETAEGSNVETPDNIGQAHEEELTRDNQMEVGSSTL